MTKDEALKMAREALEANQPVNYCLNSRGEKSPILSGDPLRFERNAEAITACQAALAQPEQEPVSTWGVATAHQAEVQRINSELQRLKIVFKTTGETE
jgi:hypothetical protein